MALAIAILPSHPPHYHNTQPPYTQDIHVVFQFDASVGAVDAGHAVADYARRMTRDIMYVKKAPLDVSQH